MSKDERTDDDIWTAIDNAFKEFDKLWKAWLTNNYTVTVALANFGSESFKLYLRWWLEQEYWRSKGHNDTP